MTEGNNEFSNDDKIYSPDDDLYFAANRDAIIADTDRRIEEAQARAWALDATEEARALAMKDEERAVKEQLRALGAAARFDSEMSQIQDEGLQ